MGFFGDPTVDALLPATVSGPLATGPNPDSNRLSLSMKSQPTSWRRLRTGVLSGVGASQAG